MVEKTTSRRVKGMTALKSSVPWKTLRLTLLAGAFSSFLAASPQDLKEEHSDHYRRWLEQDVAYIISPEERQVFLKLTTDAERERFVEQFWIRRDPDPRTAFNEFQEEHYRRIAFANENFKSGIDGWATDRGRIYITFGPPDQREAFVSGGVYERPLQEGGGTTSTFPWEKWFYRQIPGLGSGIEIEFVDPTLSGEYRIALRSSEKDALFHSEGSGNTVFEDMGVLDRADRLKADILMRPLGLNNDHLVTDLSQTPFARVERYFQLKQPPLVRFDDLREMVDLQISYDQIPFGLEAHFSRINREVSMATLTMKMDAFGLGASPSSMSPAQPVRFNLYGRVVSLSRRIVAEFDEQIGLFPTSGHTVGLYQRKLPLRPGRYKLTVVVKESDGPRMGVKDVLVLVPAFEEKEMALSPPVLSRLVVPADADSSIVDGFVTWSGWKVYPSIDRRFDSREPLYAYLEIYGFAVDQASGQPDLSVGYSLERDGETVVDNYDSLSTRALNYVGDRAVVLTSIPLEGRPSGHYRLALKVQDRIRGDTRSAALDFELVDSRPASAESTTKKRPSNSQNSTEITGLRPK